MATTTQVSTMRSGSPALYSTLKVQEPFMRFEHAVACLEMSKRMQLKFSLMSDIQRTCYLLDKENKKIRAKFQSWSDYNPVNLVKNGNQTLKQIAQTSSKMDGLVEQAQQMIEAFSGILSGAKSLLFGENGQGVLMKLMNVIVNVCLARQSCVLISLLYNISVQFGSEIYSFISKSFNFRKEATQATIAEFQSNGYTTIYGETDIFGDLSEIIKENRGVCASVLGSVIALVLVRALGLPGNWEVDKCLKFFGDRSRNLKNIFDFGKVAGPMFQSIGDYLLEGAFGKLGETHELDSYLSGYDAWVADVLSVHKVGENLAQRVEQDKELCFRIDRLYRKGIEFAGILGANKKLSNEKCVLHYNKVFKVVEEYKKLSDFSGVFGNKPRTKPLVIWAFGESGVGKSGMAWPLACDLNAALSDTLEEAQDYAKNIYFRNVEQEYWDGYNGAKICVYDDFGQRADTSASPNEEFMEVIRAANLAPYPLHVAQLEEKKRTKFCSQVLLLTSNVLNQNTPSLTFPDAYRRRVDLCVKVEIKDEFTKECYSKGSQSYVKRLDRSKCNGPVDTRPYLLKIYDPESQEPQVDSETGMTKTLDYDQFVSLAIKTLMSNHSDSITMNENMSARMNEQRFEKLKRIAHFQAEFEDAPEPNPFEGWGEGKSLASIWENSEGKIVRLLSSLPSRGEVMASAKNYISNLIKLAKEYKTYLVTLGLLIGGIGLWKYFSTKPVTPKHHNRPGCTLEANVSGDNITRRAQVIQTEAFASGDCRTNKHKVVKRESLGDDITHEANVSGDSITRVKAKVVTESVDAEMQAWADATSQDLISHRIYPNLYKIIRIRDNIEHALLNGLFVRDNVMLVPRHVMSNVNDTDNIRIENLHGAIFELPMKAIRVVNVEARSIEFYKDAVLWGFPRYVHAHADLVKHFQTMPELSLQRMNICVPTLRCVKDKPAACILGNARAEMLSATFAINGVEYNVRDSLLYNLNTIGGDCGAPVIASEKSVIRKICGIHTMASTDGSVAYGQSITRADLERSLANFKTIITDPDMLPNVTLKNVDLQLNTLYFQEEMLVLYGLPAATFGFVGGVSKVPFVPSETDIKASIIHGVVTEPITKPAYLYRSDVNLMDKNIAKCSVNTPFIPTGEVDNAVQEVKVHLLRGNNKGLNRLFTFEEAIAGSDVSEYVSSLNRSSSPGYPWILNRKPGTHGKTGWLGDDQTFVFDPEVRAAVEHRINLAKQGIRLPVAWTATLKDERRPIEKVEALKTRVFANGPMDYTIAVRMYFIGFVAHVMENRIDNEQSVGTNPMGIDWTRTAKRLSKYGKKVFAGDFSTFDGTLNSCILSRFVEVVNLFYNDGPENARIREVLMMDVFNSFWICEGRYIALTHSQPSGNPLTTILNSFYNSVSMRIAYYRAAKKANVVPPKFDEVVTMVSYGDDNEINFSDSVAEWFNQLTVTDAYASFGMIYTDEGKTGEMSAYRRLEETAYLKRGFRYVNGIYRAPMDLAVILETPNWIRKCPDYDLACKMNVESAIRELAQHPREVFDEWSNKYCQAFYDRTGEYPQISTYDSYNEEWDREMTLTV